MTTPLDPRTWIAQLAPAAVTLSTQISACPVEPLSAAAAAARRVFDHNPESSDQLPPESGEVG
jgi:hypothetical protein